MTSKFEEALLNCSREPIHIPGAIQPFGVLVALDDELGACWCMLIRGHQAAMPEAALPKAGVLSRNKHLHRIFEKVNPP